ncbi:zinc finger, c4 type (two domains) domain-containing protein [Ditylenchus destructor]|nr:zinc finger, c4 type (two domains) domain-containing protein [Ditylenchus destructor]
MAMPSYSCYNQCAVCQSVPHGSHFGVPACRSCASFFRRTVFERKVYKCKKSNNCDDFKEGMRIACRACRLQQCLRAGMRYELKKDQGTGQPWNTPGTSQLPLRNLDPFLNSFETTGMILELSLSTPLLDRYRDGFRNFASGEKSLFTIENPQTIFSDPQFKPLKLADWVRMERGSASLLHTMCINYFEPFNTLPHNKKIEILKEYWKYFQILYAAYMSVVYFEKSSQNYSQHAAGINKLVMHYGYYEDMETIREFFPKEECNPEKAVRYCEPMFKLLFDYLNQYYQLKITELEVIAMFAILFWNTVDKFEMLNPEMRRKRDSIYVELNSILMRSLGGINGSIRLGHLVSFIHKTTTQAAEFYEVWLSVKIDLPEFRDAWDDDVCPISADHNHTNDKECNS